MGFSKWQDGVAVEEDELEQGAHGHGCGAEGEDRWNRTRWTETGGDRRCGL